MFNASEWPLDLVVTDSVPLAAEIRSLTLKSADGGLLPMFSAGAHIRFRIALTDGENADAALSGIAERSHPVERCYSLVNSGAQSSHYEIAVKLEASGRGGSRFMHALRLGDHIHASLPKNHFPLYTEPHEPVLIAGGIGITPILSMARELTMKGAAYRLHYVARSPETMAYRTTIAQLSGDSGRLYFDHGDPARGMPLADVVGPAAPGRHLYVCGPRPLIDAVVATARAQQWSPERVHFELFSAPDPQAGDAVCRVVLQRSGLTLDVPADQSILDAMIDAGVDPMFDCKRGECSACAVRVLSGEPDHRDYVLSDDERNQDHLMCVCVSRARQGELVLDA